MSVTPSWEFLIYHPGAYLIAGGLWAGLFPSYAWATSGVFSFGAAAVFVLRRLPNLDFTASVADFQLIWYRGDALSLLFTVVFTVVAGLGLIYGWYRMRRGEAAAAMIYAGCAISTVLAGDWVTFFVFWEGMAIASTALIWLGGTKQSRRAGMRYLLFHAVGGALLFVGILLHLAGGGPIEVLALTGTGPPFWLILTAVAVNAAIPPLHAWLTDAYPEASTAGSVFLSAFTTKTAVYALLRIFPGAEVLVPLGIVMTLYGVIFAILENDVRRLLAYHIVSQVGYMVTGVGLGTPLALAGAAAHAYSHILYKALLFMGAGALIEATGFRRLSDLGGVWRRMRFVTAMYLVGAVSISGWPLFNGFVSKSLIVSAAAEAHAPWTELLLTLAAVGTFLSVGLKLPWFAFGGADRGVVVRKLPSNIPIAMGIAGFLCFAYGVLPFMLYRMLPWEVAYQPFTFDHLSSSVQLLVGTGLLFFLVVRTMTPAARRTLDVDWLWRGPLREAASDAGRGLAGLAPAAREARRWVVTRIDAGLRRAAAGRAAPAAPAALSFRDSIGWTIFFAAAAAAILLAVLDRA